MYWIYDIPNWKFFLITLAAFVGVSLVGLFLTRPLVRRVVGGLDKYNDAVNYYFAAIGVLYGLTLGLIAVGTWENFNEVDGKVSKEADALGSLYRDLDGYPQPLRGESEDLLRAVRQENDRGRMAGPSERGRARPERPGSGTIRKQGHGF